MHAEEERIFSQGYILRESLDQKQNLPKLDDAQRGDNLVSCLDLIRSVLKEGEHPLKLFFTHTVNRF